MRFDHADGDLDLHFHGDTYVYLKPVAYPDQHTAVYQNVHASADLYANLHTNGNGQDDSHVNSHTNVYGYTDSDGDAVDSKAILAVCCEVGSQPLMRTLGGTR